MNERQKDIHKIDNYKKCKLYQINWIHIENNFILFYYSKYCFLGDVMYILLEKDIYCWSVLRLNKNRKKTQWVYQNVIYLKKNFVKDDFEC